MKKVAVAVLLFVCVVSLNAQIRVGVRGGVVLDNSKIGYPDVKSDQKTGFDGGLTLDFSLPLLGWNINTGASYANRGFSLKHERGLNNEGQMTGETYHFTTHSLEIPVNIRREFNLLAVKPFVQTGLYGSYILSGKVKDSETSQSIKFDDESDKFTTGANIGIGCVFISKISLLANYSIGFNKNKYTFGESTVSRRNQSCTFSLGYLF